MTLKVRVRSRARTDIDRAAHWHESRRAGLGDEFLNEVEATFARITENPESYAEVYRSTRRALLRRFPFGVFYRVLGETAIVVAVMHSSRNPDEWEART